MLLEQLPEYRIDILYLAYVFHREVGELAGDRFIFVPQRLVGTGGDLDIGVVPHSRHDVPRQDLPALWRVVGPVVAIRSLRRIDVPLMGRITLVDDVVHHLEGAGDDSAAGFLGVEELMLVHLLGLGMVADIDHLDVFVGPAKK